MYVVYRAECDEVEDKKIIFGKVLDIRFRMCYYTLKQGRWGQPLREVKPMSLTEAIALLMLVIAAVSLGIQIKK